MKIANFSLFFYSFKRFFSDEIVIHPFNENRGRKWIKKIETEKKNQEKMKRIKKDHKVINNNQWSNWIQSSHEDPLASGYRSGFISFNVFVCVCVCFCCCSHCGFVVTWCLFHYSVCLGHSNTKWLINNN